ncbi:Prolyl endopeptidase [Plasmodiophora brassicae]
MAFRRATRRRRVLNPLHAVRVENRRFRKFRRQALPDAAARAFLMDAEKIANAVVDVSLPPMDGCNGRMQYSFEGSLVRRFDAATGRETVVVNGDCELMEISAAYRPVMRSLTASDDGRFVAFTVSVTDDPDHLDAFVKDTTTGAIASDRLPAASGNVVWLAGRASVVYANVDSLLRPARVMHHAIAGGPVVCPGKAVYEETDPEFVVNVNRTKDARYVVVTSASKMACESWIAAADDPELDLQCVRKREPNLDYFVEHLNGYLYMITNADGATDYKLVRAPIRNLESWSDVFVPPVGTVIEDAEYFADSIILYVREEGVPRVLSVSVPDRDSHVSVHHVSLPADWVGAITPVPNKSVSASSVRFTFQSTLIPEAVLEYNWQLLRLKEISRQTAAEKLLSQFHTEVVSATARDGARVPITVTKPRLSRNDRRLPTIAVVYGAYGEPLDPEFSLRYSSALLQGFAVAFCHVRGGGDLGRNWYAAGRGVRKQNTFSDFIACAEYLIESGLTSPDLLCARVLDSPFVDVLTPMLNPSSSPLAFQERSEWGNPSDKSALDYISSYSPFQNIKKQAYPNLLISASAHDSRVPLDSILKYMQRLRDHQTNPSALLLMRIWDDRGHVEHSDAHVQLADDADEFAFITAALSTG